ncbi:MAG: hypothetical protein DRH11_11345 [Deltaproteobacteria bacterium]|nr:MAG: hypothetical protein DRH11_11345 [Deltaproteobacteria bacterium]
MRRRGIGGFRAEGLPARGGGYLRACAQRQGRQQVMARWLIRRQNRLMKQALNCINNYWDVTMMIEVRGV